MMTRLVLAAVFVTAALPVLADTMATGAEIIAAISGNTVQGGMSASGAYIEFYAKDGSIKAADYSGEWSVKGDTMCFIYEGESEVDCWNARIKGTAITWVQDGVDGGSGTIQPGNPNGY